MRKAVVTLCVGERYSKIGKLTHPTFKAYADRIGAEFLVISERQFKTPVICYEKLQLREMLRQYDRIIYLDTDIIVRDTCVDLFSIVPYGWFGACSEGAHTNRRPHLMLAATQFGYKEEHLTRWDAKYFNA